MNAANHTSTPKNASKTFNRAMYGGFVALSIYFLLVSHDYGSAMSNLGIALVFDPFDQRVMWNQRPLHQRVWLGVHVAVVLVLSSFLFVSLFLRS